MVTNAASKKCWSRTSFFIKVLVVENILRDNIIRYSSVFLSSEASVE
jgi:hypothetical protein